MFKVHCGWTPKGRARWKKFETLPEASEFCNGFFARYGVVLSVVRK